MRKGTSRDSCGAPAGANEWAQPSAAHFRDAARRPLPGFPSALISSSLGGYSQEELPVPGSCARVEEGALASLVAW